MIGGSYAQGVSRPHLMKETEDFKIGLDFFLELMPENL
jgi:hypothetical protein